MKKDSESPSNPNPTSDEAPKHFPFADFCGSCTHFLWKSCPFSGKVDAGTRWRSIGCTRFKE